MVSRGERPGYRLTPSQDGRWELNALPWLPMTASNRLEALAAAKTAIAKWLEVHPGTFDVQIGPDANRGN